MNRGEPSVGSGATDHTTIREVGWFDLRNPTIWDPLVLGDPITLPLLRQVRAALGYAAGEV
jgi:hypothetical protein